MEHLGSCGVGCGIHYPVPCHLQPVYSDVFGSGSYPVCEGLADSVLSLPLYPELSEEQLEYVVSVVKKFKGGV